VSILENAVVESWLAENCCGRSTGAVQVPEERESMPLEAVGRGMAKAQLTEKIK
jgi:hypothetical protein